MDPVKLLVTSKNNLQFKYGKKFPQVEKLLKQVVAVDKKRKRITKVVFIDDPKSAKAAGIKVVKSISPNECKRAIDDLYKKHIPVYTVIIGAQDIFPFVEILNPADDEDLTVPSDLPYACDTPYSRDIAAFTGPTRVVGRIPDIPGQQDSISYLKRLINNSMQHKAIPVDEYRKYFAVSAQVWKVSTRLSLQSIFSDTKNLLLSPVKSEKDAAKYSSAQFRPLTHFYNCHGVLSDPCFYGQRGNNYPEALRSTSLEKNISPGTIVAAECCYGAELFDPSEMQPRAMSVASTYLGNDAIAYLGSSTIAYGPADSQGLADLMTQYFIKSLLNGATSGRALLEARQRFLTVCGPQLDPYEQKTFAQFYLLGDPSVQPAFCEEIEGTVKAMSGNTVENNRINLFNKGVSLKRTIAPSKKQKRITKSSDQKQLNDILKTTNFEKAEKEIVYEVKPMLKGITGLQKKMAGETARFRTFIKPDSRDGLYHHQVLVVKEDKEQILGWRVYESR